jgi:hypothetical protein
LSLALASIAVSFLGCLSTLGIMAHESRGKFSGALVAVGLLHAAPYLLCCVFAAATRASRSAGAWVLAASVAAFLVGVGLPVATFFGPTATGDGLIFAVLWFYEGLACGPLLWLAVRSMKGRTADRPV